MSENREKFEKFLVKLDANELEKLLKSKEYEQYKSIIQERIKTFYSILAEIKITDSIHDLTILHVSLHKDDYLHKIIDNKIKEIVLNELKDNNIEKFLKLKRSYSQHEVIKPILEKKEIELFGEQGITKDISDKEFDKIYEDDN